MSETNLLWFHVANGKLFAKIVGKNLRSTLNLRHSHVLENLARSAGYLTFTDSLTAPHAVELSFAHWKLELEAAFGVGADALMPIDELGRWFKRLFVEFAPLCTHAYVPPTHPRSIGDEADDARVRRHHEPEDPEELTIPAHVNHEQTVVDVFVKKHRVPVRPR